MFYDVVMSVSFCCGHAHPSFVELYVLVPCRIDVVEAPHCEGVAVAVFADAEVGVDTADDGGYFVFFDVSVMFCDSCSEPPFDASGGV